MLMTINTLNISKYTVNYCNTRPFQQKKKLVFNMVIPKDVCFKMDLNIKTNFVTCGLLLSMSMTSEFQLETVKKSK